MNEPRVFVRLVLLLSFVFAGLLSGSGAGSAVAQASATSYDSPATGASVRTTGPWTIDTASIESSSDMEMLLLYGQYDGMVVSFLPAGTDLVMARDIFLQEFSSVFGTFIPIDRGAYGNVSYSLDITSSEGIEFGVFSLFLGQRASGYVEYYLYFGPVLYFEQGFASAQQNVTVNGVPVFEGVEGGGLQDLLTANAGVTGASTDVPSGNVVDSNAPQAPAQATEAPPADAPIEEPAPETDVPVGASEEGAAYIAAIQSELAYLQTTVEDFTVDFTSLEGDTSGVATDEINRIVAEWAAYPDRAAGIAVPPGYEDINASYQALAGQVGQLSSSWYGFVDSLQSGDDAAIQSTLQGFFDMLVGVQGQIDDLNAQLDELPETGSGEAVQRTGEPAGEPEETQPEAAEEEPTEEVTDLTGQEEIDDGSTRGGANLPAGDEEGAQEATSNETETGRGGQGADLADFEDLGLIDEGEYVSPQFDVEITWEDTWIFASDFDEPIASDEEGVLIR